MGRDFNPTYLHVLTRAISLTFIDVPDSLPTHCLFSGSELHSAYFKADLEKFGIRGTCTLREANLRESGAGVKEIIHRKLQGRPARLDIVPGYRPRSMRTQERRAE